MTSHLQVTPTELHKSSVVTPASRATGQTLQVATESIKLSSPPPPCCSKNHLLRVGYTIPASKIELHVPVKSQFESTGVHLPAFCKRFFIARDIMRQHAEHVIVLIFLSVRPSVRTSLRKAKNAKLSQIKQKIQ